MTDRQPKRPRDANQLAKVVVDVATGEKLDESKVPKKGRSGGLVGGKARAKALTPERRRQIAKKAAKTRWRKESVNGD